VYFPRDRISESTGPRFAHEHLITKGTKAQRKISQNGGRTRIFSAFAHWLCLGSVFPQSQSGKIAVIPCVKKTYLHLAFSEIGFVFSS
jgi:hypothetical protein